MALVCTATPAETVSVSGIALAPDTPNNDLSITTSGAGTVNWMIHASLNAASIAAAEAAQAGAISSGSFAHDATGQTITRATGWLHVWGASGSVRFWYLDSSFASATLAVTNIAQSGKPFAFANIDQLEDYHVSIFMDWSKSARGWQSIGGGGSQDAQGNLTGMTGTGLTADFFWSSRGDDGRDWSDYNGSFTVRWTGSGSVADGVGGTTVVSGASGGECEFTAAIDGNKLVRFTGIDGANPPVITYLGQTSNLAAHDAGGIFDPDMMGYLQGRVRGIRFMGAQYTNHTPSTPSPVTAEADYPLASWRRWQRMPLSVMVDMCNELSCDMWVNIGHEFPGSMIANWAAYINANLDPGLECVVELSNEHWNGAFFQELFYRQAAIDASWTGDQYTIRYSYYAKSAVEMFDYFLAEMQGVAVGSVNRALAKSQTRFSLMLGSFTTVSSVSSEVMDAPVWYAEEPSNHIEPWRVARYISIADYFGFSTSTYDADVIATFTSSGAAAAEAAADTFFTTTDSERVSVVKGHIDDHFALLTGTDHLGATRSGISLMTYEGASNHLFYAPSGTAERAWHYQHMQSQRMARHIIDLQDHLYDGGAVASGLWSLHNRPSTFGSWGMFEHFKRLDPRANALLNYSATKRRA